MTSEAELPCKRLVTSLLAYWRVSHNQSYCLQFHLHIVKGIFQVIPMAILLEGSHVSSPKVLNSCDSAWPTLRPHGDAWMCLKEVSVEQLLCALHHAGCCEVRNKSKPVLEASTAVWLWNDTNQERTEPTGWQWGSRREKAQCCKNRVEVRVGSGELKAFTEMFHTHVHAARRFRRALGTCSIPRKSKGWLLKVKADYIYL